MIDQTKHNNLPTMHLGAPTVVGPLTLVSIRALDAGDGRTIHATALNVRHDLVLAA